MQINRKEIWTTPKRIFTGNKISREEFVGKFFCNTRRGLARIK